VPVILSIFVLKKFVEMLKSAKQNEKILFNFLNIIQFLKQIQFFRNKFKTQNRKKNDKRTETFLF